MRSKAPLALMEQLVMLLVFAVAAALCLQAFARSDQLSRRGEARDRAAVLCQTAAETVRHTAGDLSAVSERLEGAVQTTEDSLLFFYGLDWRPVAATSPDVYPFGYTLGVSRLDTDTPGLGRAAVWVREDESGQELFRLEVSWQEEVSAHG